MSQVTLSPPEALLPISEERVASAWRTDKDNVYEPVESTESARDRLTDLVSSGGQKGGPHFENGSSFSIGIDWASGRGYVSNSFNVSIRRERLLVYTLQEMFTHPPEP